MNKSANGQGRRERVPPGGKGNQAVKIAEGAIAVIASQGLARLTHRAVAVEADVSLAATTRHFKTKSEIIEIASRRLLEGYIEAFHRAVERHRSGSPMAADLPAFVRLLTSNAAGNRRQDSLAWCEIMLSAGRSPEGRELSAEWFDGLFECWLGVAAAFELPQPAMFIQTAIDAVIGLLFVTLPLGLTPETAVRCLSEGFKRELVSGDGVYQPEAGPGALTPKSLQTRNRVIEAALSILIEHGPEAVTYKEISQRAGLTIAAPAYHFGSIESLTAVVQDHMFAISRARYREILASLPAVPGDLEELVDFTSAIFVREVTEFADFNRANYAIWLEAARKPILRSSVAQAVVALQSAWFARLQQINPNARESDGLAALALYVGKLVRLLATGSRTIDLVQARAEFGTGLAIIIDPNSLGTIF